MSVQELTQLLRCVSCRLRSPPACPPHGCSTPCFPAAGGADTTPRSRPEPLLPSFTEPRAEKRKYQPPRKTSGPGSRPRPPPGAHRPGPDFEYHQVPASQAGYRGKGSARWCLVLAGDQLRGPRSTLHLKLPNCFHTEDTECGGRVLQRNTLHQQPPARGPAQSSAAEASAPSPVSRLTAAAVLRARGSLCPGPRTGTTWQMGKLLPQL